MVVTMLQDNIVMAAPLPRNEPGVLFLPDTAIVMDDGYELSIQGVLGAIFILICALLLWFRGLLDFRSSQGLVGFIVLAFVAWVLLANFEPAGTFGRNRWTIYLVVPIACGLIGALLMSCTLHLYLLLLGGLGGLAVGLWILGWQTDLSIKSNWGRAILLIILVVVGCTFSALDRIFHMFGTAFTGAYMLFLGLDVFFHTGFTYCFTTTLDANPAHAHIYQATRETHIIHAVLIVAAIIGLMAQLCFVV
ncbi:hypothetical protein INT45_002728 [Circinella minor]|uniref:TM7S3/TM198-like domain-containing protein n=1 Tax=Circinella minor TaxID=1195481 RepID=A0A8H7VIE7_9FUNG|nr:hypothetical protein INT45_002728 [Circinella minor]